MTKRVPKAGVRKITTVTEVPVSDVEEESGPTEIDYGLEEVVDLEKLNAFKEQFPNAGLTCKIYDERGSFCFVSPDPFHINEETVRKRCGSGNFVIRVYLNGKYRQSIPLPIRHINPDPNEVATTPNAGTPSTTPIDRHSEFLEKMLLTLLTREPIAPASGPSLSDMTAALANLDSLRGKQESGVDLVLKGMELAQRFNGETDWKTSLIQTGKEIIPQVLQGIEMFKSGNPNPMLNPSVTPATQQDALLRAGIAYCKKKAIAGVLPEQIINMIEVNAEEYQGLIHAFLSMEFADFAKLDPEIGTEPFFSWFRPLYDGLRLAFSPANSVVTDTDGDLGNVDHPGNHVTSGARERGDTKPNRS